MGCMVALVQFNFFVSDLHDGAEPTVSKLADDTSVADGPEGHAAIQHKLDRLKK